MLVELADTDAESELVLYTFTLNRSGSTHWISDLRLVAETAIDLDAINKVWSREDMVHLIIYIWTLM